MKTVKSLNQAIDMSIEANQSKEYSASFKIIVGNEVWTVESVGIANRDILAYCDKGYATFLVDSYGDRHLACLFDWERN